MNDFKSVEEETPQAVKMPPNQLQQSIDDKEMIAEKPTRHYRTIIFQGYLISATVVFIILTVLATTTTYFTFDITISRELQQINLGWFKGLMAVLSWIGFTPQSGIIFVAVIFVLFLAGLRWETIVTTVSLVGISIIGTVIKILVERPRPSADLVNIVREMKDYSFPSGHVLYFTTLFGFLLFLAYILLKRSWWRTLLLFLLGAMIILIGPSRIYEGQHWASDVMGSYLLGTVWLSLWIIIYRWGKPRFFTQQPIAQ